MKVTKYIISRLPRCMKHFWERKSREGLSVQVLCENNEQNGSTAFMKTVDPVL